MVTIGTLAAFAPFLCVLWLDSSGSQGCSLEASACAISGRAHGVLAWYVHWRIQCVRARRSQRSNSHFARCMIPLPGGTLLRFDLFSLCRVSEDLFSLCRVSVGFDLFSRASVSQYKCRIDKRTCAFNL